MQEEGTQILEKWKNEMETVWRAIPKAYRNDHSVKRTLQCDLYGRLQEMGFRLVADYMPPRIQERSIDLIALNENLEIIYALCVDPLVTLAAVKSLSSFEAAHKVIFTMGHLEKKVKESRFFLSPDIEHLHLKPFESPF